MKMPKFYNNMKLEFSDDATENVHNRWYIKVGFCGFNSSANNGFGYETKEKAESTILRYQNKSEYIRKLTEGL